MDIYRAPYSSVFTPSSVRSLLATRYASYGVKVGQLSAPSGILCPGASRSMAAFNSAASLVND